MVEKQTGRDQLNECYKSIQHIPPTTAEEEIQLSETIKTNDPESPAYQAAINRLVTGNMEEVFIIARKMENRRRAVHMTVLDLVQEGTFGLVKAAKKYDYAKYRTRFKTLAQRHIYKSMNRAIENDDREIRIPVHALETLNAVFKARRKLAKALGKEPSTEEIAAEIGDDPKKIAHLRSSIQRPAQMDHPTKKDTNARWANDITNQDHTEAITQPTHERILADQIAELIAGSLSVQEEAVIQTTFSINQPRALSNDTTAKRMRLSEDQVRRMRTKALKKMRATLTANPVLCDSLQACL